MRFLTVAAAFLLAIVLAGAADLRQAPEIVRGVEIRGALSENVSQTLRQRGVTLTVFRLHSVDRESLEQLAENIECAARNDLQSVVLYEPGKAETDIAENWRALLKRLLPTNKTIRGYALAAGGHAALYERQLEAFLPEFRELCPEGWLICHFSGKVLSGSRVTYTAIFDAKDEFAPVRTFLKKHNVPFLAGLRIGNPELLLERARMFDAENCSWYSIPAGRTLAEELEILKRPFLKGAAFDERFKGLADEFRAVHRPGTLNFAFITDTHYQLRPEGRQAYGGTSVESMRNMARMAKELKLDFVANAGDMVDGNSPHELNFKEIRATLAALQSSGLPVLVAIGNHDDGTYYCGSKARNGSEAITPAEWRDLIVKPVLGRVVADEANPEGNYYYCDFPDQKIRVVVLSVSENQLLRNEKGELKYFSIGTMAYHEPQLKWLATKALDLPDAREWSVLFISHARPGQVINGNVVTEIIEAFRRGEVCRPRSVAEGNFPHNVSADFSGQGPGRVLALLHGHNHRELVNWTHGYPQIGFLNGLCYRNKPICPPRAIDTPDMESWTVLSVDPVNNLITGLRFGAGNDFRYRTGSYSSPASSQK